MGADHPRAPILLLDVMDTLVRDPFREEMPAFFGISFEEMLADKHPTAWVEFEHGEMSEAEFLARFFADERPYDHGGFRDHVRASYRWIEGVEPLLADLHERGVEMHALSNYPCWYEMIEERLQLSRYLSWTFVSCETGVRKPHPDAYRNAARTLDVAPDRCLFVDDRQTNVDAAVEIGMDAVRFEDARQLRRELERRGVLR